MPLPERYAREVPDMVAIWQPEGYFKAQAQIWLAQSEARHELYDAPNAKQLGRTDAYELVKNLSQQAMNEKTQLRSLTEADPLITSILSRETLEESFSTDFYLRNIDEAYRRLGIDDSE